MMDLLLDLVPYVDALLVIDFGFELFLLTYYL